MICEVHLGFLHIRLGVLKILTYIMAALGSFFLFAGTIRNHTVAEKLFPNYDYATFYINAKIFPLMLTGTVLFFVHSLMFYFVFYDDTSVGSENNPNASAVEAQKKR